MQLTAALEQATEQRLKAEKDMLASKEELSRVSQQRAYLMKTTEVYEADKRELEQEVSEDGGRRRRRRKRRATWNVSDRTDRTPSPETF